VNKGHYLKENKDPIIKEG